MLAEDCLTSRIFLQSLLEQSGYEVIAVEDGAEALRLLQTETVDIVVSDVEMPNMDGFELTQTICANPAWSQLPVILVTSLASAEHRRRGVDVGANAYIVKGEFEQGTLLDAIRRRRSPRFRQGRSPASKTCGPRQCACRWVAAFAENRRRRSGAPSAHSGVGGSGASVRTGMGTAPAAVAIGASLGGPQALVRLLSSLEHPFPVPILIAQHLAPGFVPGFARWLAERTVFRVKVVEPGRDTEVPAGDVAVADGDLDLVVRGGHEGGLVVGVQPATTAAAPCVDVLFESLLETGLPADFVVLSGTGKDGSRSVSRLVPGKHRLFVQDPAEAMAGSMPEKPSRMRVSRMY